MNTKQEAPCKKDSLSNEAKKNMKICFQFTGNLHKKRIVNFLVASGNLVQILLDSIVPRQSKGFDFPFSEFVFISNIVLFFLERKEVLLLYFTIGELFA